MGSLVEMTDSPTPSERARGLAANAHRLPAGVYVVTGGLLAFVVAGTSVGLIRETLHFNCSWGVGGEWGPNGTWVCADGIGYLNAAITIGGVSALFLAIGLLTAVTAPSLTRSITYLALALTSVAWIGWWTYFGATFYTGPRPAGETGISVWAATVLPGVALSALGLMAGAFGALGALRTRRQADIALACGVGLILIGTAIQPGIGVATFVAAGLLAAAGSRTPAH